MHHCMLYSPFEVRQRVPSLEQRLWLHGMREVASDGALTGAGLADAHELNLTSPFDRFIRKKQRCSPLVIQPALSLFKKLAFLHVLPGHLDARSDGVPHALDRLKALVQVLVLGMREPLIRRLSGLDLLFERVCCILIVFQEVKVGLCNESKGTTLVVAQR